MSAPILRTRASAVVMATAALAAESALLVACALGYRPLALFAGHVLLLTVMGLWAFRPTQRRAQYTVLLWVATAAFGPLGPAGVLLATVLEWHYTRQATGIDEWHAMLFPPTTVDVHAELWRRIGQRASDLPGDRQVMPFLDVLAFGSVPQRQSVIAIIVQQFRPAFAQALKAALRDEHNVIRVQAATAIARLENEFLERTMRLEAAVRDSPDDASAILALATHYDDQAFAGLLDATREQDCRVRAAEGYERYLGQHPEDDAVRFRLARLQQRRGRWSDAEQLFRRLVEGGHPGARHWFMESLFAQGQYSEVRAVAAARGEDESDQTLAPDVADALALWSGVEAA